MNPIVTPTDGHVVFSLTDEDRALVKKVKLKEGNRDALECAMHEMCVMQMVTMLTLPKEERIPPPEGLQRAWDLDHGGYDTSPPCVSGMITSAMIGLNDTCHPQQRWRLRALVEDIMNTAPVKRRVTSGGRVVDIREDENMEYRKAESERARMLRYVEVIPFAKAMKLIREAAALYKVTATTEGETK